MKKFYFLALMALIGIAFSSCENMNKKQKEFFIKDLQGKWRTDGKQEYWRFSTEQVTLSGYNGYYWAWEWDEGEDVQESDRTSHPYGNGWFMYKIQGDQLLEIHKAEYDWDDVPKVYTLIELTSTRLVYHPKEYPKDKRYYTKQPN